MEGDRCLDYPEAWVLLVEDESVKKPGWKVWVFAGHEHYHGGYLLLFRDGKDRWWEEVVNTDNLTYSCDIADLVEDLLKSGFEKAARKIMEEEDLTPEDLREPCF